MQFLVESAAYLKSKRKISLDQLPDDVGAFRTAVQQAVQLPHADFIMEYYDELFETWVAVNSIDDLQGLKKPRLRIAPNILFPGQEAPPLPPIPQEYSAPGLVLLASIFKPVLKELESCRCYTLITYKLVHFLKYVSFLSPRSGRRRSSAA